MNERYKIILRNSFVWKEISLPTDKGSISIGTNTSSDMRLYEEDFEDSFEIIVEMRQREWELSCNRGCYIDIGDNRILMSIGLKHGLKCLIFSNEKKLLCELFFMIDFDYVIRPYDLVINIGNINKIMIGSNPEYNIVLLDDYVSNVSVELRKLGNTLELRTGNSEFGICHNGTPMKQSCKISNTDFFSIGQFSFYYRDDQLFATNKEHLMIRHLQFAIIHDSESALEYPKFNRNTKLEVVIPEKQIEILNPPDLPKKSQDKLIMHLLPSLLMIILIVAIRGGMAQNGANISYILFSVCSMAVGIITSIMSYFSEKKKYSEDVEEREKTYQEYIGKKTAEIKEKRQEEENLLNKKYNNESENIKRIYEFSGDLFDRMPEDEEFLKIRVGTGDYEAKWKIKYSHKEQIAQNDELALLPEKIAEDYKNVHNVPVVADLIKAHNLGVIGKEKVCYEMVKIITLDLCTHHYFKDIKLFYILDSKREKQFSWLRFLPHVYNDYTNVRNIVCDESSKSWQYEWLYKELCMREAAGKNCPKQHIVVFLIDDMGIKRHPISRYFEKAHLLNVHFISFERYKERLPLYCGQIVSLDDQMNGTLVNHDDKLSVTKFVMPLIDDKTMYQMAMKLAPVYCDEISLESALTKNVTLFQVLQIFHAEDLNLKERWKMQDICRTMAAPIGVKTKDELVYLDLHEKADGPHGLVAGTTGSGKSELLQTYILSMATLHSPDEVAFVLIDFKGGGMANQFKELPHLAGAITDIDGREINRSLQSIRAELDKRKELFAEADVNSINHYIRKYQEGKVKTPLPHLIIIVDEFAELKAEQPEFMKELISASRIGRSLGVHLILATQKPAGQVSDQIWSNSRFKMCLKVQTREDSNEVLKSPLAAEIVEPGRAYLQVGNNEVFELFQSAYSGAQEKSSDGQVEGKEFSISSVKLSGERTKVFEQKKRKLATESRTQLEAIVKYITTYCIAEQISSSKKICLPPLPEILHYPVEHNTKKEEVGISVDIGIYDMPENQYQGEINLHISRNNTMIIGSSQYGKTNLLQVIVRGLVEKYSPEEIQLYVLDFGSMIFGNYENIHHIGGVVYSYEDEKCKNLFKMLNRETAKRKEQLIAAGVSSYLAYLEAGFTDMPQIVVFIDNLSAMRELYLMENDFLLPLCRDGISVGISFVIANMQTSGIGYKYLSNFEQKLALFCNDTTEYNMLFDHCRVHPLNIPGRCIIEKDKEIYEAQTYLAFDGEKEYDRVKQIHRLAEECNSKYPDVKAKRIPSIPEVLTREILEMEYHCISDQESFVLGLDFGSVLPLKLNWIHQNVIAISGSHEKTAQMFKKYLAETLTFIEADTYVIDDYMGCFETYSMRNNVQLYSRSVEDVKEILDDIQMTLEERYQQRENSGIQAVISMKPIVLLVQNQDVISKISNDRQLLSLYKDIVSRYKGLKCTIIYTNIENASIGFNSPEVLKMMKEDRQFIVFDNLLDTKLFDVPSSVARKYRNPLEDGEGYLVRGNELAKIKIVSLSNKNS